MQQIEFGNSGGYQLPESVRQSLALKPCVLTPHKTHRLNQLEQLYQYYISKFGDPYAPRIIHGESSPVPKNAGQKGNDIFNTIINISSDAIAC